MGLLYYNLFMMFKKYLCNTYVTMRGFFRRLNPNILKGTGVLFLAGIIVCVCLLPVPQKAASSSNYLDEESMDSRDAGAMVVMELGANGSEVVKLQKRLNELGYYTDHATGVYDGKTANAVSEFQQQNELNDTGKADYTTLDMIYNQENTARTAQADNSYQYLDKGEEVALIQRGLAVAGYFDLECDGVYGLATRSAVMSFQTDNGLLSNGKASGETFELLSEIAQPVGVSAYTEVTAESSEADIMAVQQALADLGYMSAENLTGYYGSITQNALTSFQKQLGLSQTGEADEQTVQMLNYIVEYRGISGSAQPKYATLNPGDTSEQVNQLQEALKKLGYFSGSTTDYFGEKTEEALRDFQSYVGLSDTGIANSRTQDKLYTLAAKMPSTLKSYKLLEQEDESVAVRRLQSGLKELGYFSGNVTSYFGSKTYESVRKFQRANGLTVTGKADIATQRLLFSLAPDAENIEVIEKLNWFNDAKNLFKNGATATIIDVTTGTSFTVKRTGGYNHADVEPISASDTAAMKKMLGGSWSWNRRPIIVVYNGRYLAASMNGMPHSFDKVSGNNFSGHFCIHFAGSRTHGTNRVDEAHQAAVEKAYANGYKVLE